MINSPPSARPRLPQPPPAPSQTYSSPGRSHIHWNEHAIDQSAYGHDRDGYIAQNPALTARSLEDQYPAAATAAVALAQLHNARPDSDWGSDAVSTCTLHTVPGSRFIRIMPQRRTSGGPCTLLWSFLQSTADLDNLHLKDSSNLAQESFSHLSWRIPRLSVQLPYHPSSGESLCKEETEGIDRANHPLPKIAGDRDMRREGRKISVIA